MPTTVETTISALAFIVQVVPIGTNVGLLRVLWVMMNGSMLSSRGAIHSALSSNGFTEQEIRRSWSSVRHGSWTIAELAELLECWSLQVAALNEWRVRKHSGYRVKSVDLTAFYRPKLQGKVAKHYYGPAQRALPAMVFGLIVTSGEIKSKRVPLLQQIVRRTAETKETDFQVELLKEVAKSSQADEVVAVDAGFKLSELHEANVKQYVLRMASNCTARKNVLPPSRGRGRPLEYGAVVRPLSRTWNGVTIPATPAEYSGAFVCQGRTIRYESWHDLVTSTTKVNRDNPTFSLIVFYDPLYKEPMVLATDMTLDAEIIYHIYRDRWTVEHPPLAAKQMIGLHRQFVSSQDSCFRLPELALLAGNVLTHCAAILPPVPTGFWDRVPQATPGRLRRFLGQSIFPNLAEFDPQLRKKNSLSDHLPKGFDAPRRHATLS